jgi:hypothetical protein
MRQFLEDDALLNLYPCDGRDSSRSCRELRGRLVAPRVYIDEILVFGLTQLGSYEPHEFYSVDVFVCGPGDRMGGWEIRAYTPDYAERMARRLRTFFPSCF